MSPRFVVLTLPAVPVALRNQLFVRENSTRKSLSFAAFTMLSRRTRPFSPVLISAVPLGWRTWNQTPSLGISVTSLKALNVYLDIAPSYVFCKGTTHHVRTTLMPRAAMSCIVLLRSSLLSYEEGLNIEFSQSFWTHQLKPICIRTYVRCGVSDQSAPGAKPILSPT